MEALPPQEPQDPQDPPATQALGKVMIFSAWVLFILLLCLFFSQWSNNHRANSKALSDSPGYPAQVIIKRNNHNQYRTEGLINNQPVVFLLDTGATDVVIPGKVATDLQLTWGPSESAITAGGNVTIYLTHLDSIRIGVLEIPHQNASINPNMGGEDILLGMSALKKLNFYQQGENLVLSPQQ